MATHHFPLRECGVLLTPQERVTGQLSKPLCRKAGHGILWRGSGRGLVARRHVQAAQCSSEGNTPSLTEFLLQPIEARAPKNPHPSLVNDDLAPTPPEGRLWSTWDIMCLWIGLVVSIPTYYLAGSLVELGMAWWQGILTVLLANIIVLVPMVLTGQSGCKYGVPFPVLSRASFGIYGANLPAILRALVACGWFGIQTWVGGQALHQMALVIFGPGLHGPVLQWLGISLSELATFLLFWASQVAIIWNGVESIRTLECFSAPVLVLLCILLLYWAYVQAGGFGPMLSAPSAFRPGGPKEGQFWGTFLPALTANVGMWATLSLNIPDLTRYAKSQRDQLVGQTLGLPLFQAAFSFVGLAVTSATLVIFGKNIPDPIQLLAHIEGPIPVALSLVGLILATLSTNIAANVVAPANALVNLNPRVFSFRLGGLCTALVGLVICPWRLIQSTQGFIFTWLIGYSALLGPVGGIILTDYFFVRKTTLDIDGLYSLDTSGPYWYTNGFNTAGLWSLAMGILPNIPGFLKAVGVLEQIPKLFDLVYANAWFVGSLVSALMYIYLLKRQHPSSNVVVG